MLFNCSNHALVVILTKYFLQCAIERRKRLNSNENTGDVYYFTTLTWPENPADAISVHGPKFQNFPGGACPQTKRACFCTLTFHTLRSTVYVALPVPEQLATTNFWLTPLIVGNARLAL